jgi:RNA polymerase sigma factor (sigma-70 family)
MFAGARDLATVPRATEDRETPLTDQLIGANLRFVAWIAREYSNMGVPFEDLLNEGNIGLIEAARRFDPQHGARFITYAVWWIRKSIRNALARHSTNIYVPEYHLDKARRLWRAENRLSRTLGREATREEIFQESGIKVAKVDRILRLKSELSLDAPVGDKGTPLSGVLVDTWSINPEEDLIRRETLGLLRDGLRRLTNTEQIVIINRFGLGGGRVFTLSEIGKRLGLSRERVRQVEGEGKKKLRRALVSQQRRPWIAGNEICRAGRTSMQGRRPPTVKHSQSLGHRLGTTFRRDHSLRQSPPSLPSPP